MGRKSNAKGKEKRLARKEEQMRIAQAKEAVDKANNLKDPMESFAAFRKFKKNDVDAEIYIKRVTDLDDNTKEWIFTLEKLNMEEIYNNSSWGWHRDKKREELFDEAAWYLIAESFDGVPLGFSHFRFDLDEGIEVLYCYELQIEPTFVRKGLGKFMMQILELVAFTNQMKKVVLTVLKNNPASEFFKTINYVLDESSPEDYEEYTFPYEILSKVNRKLLEKKAQESNNGHSHSHGHGHSHQHHCCPGHH